MKNKFTILVAIIFAVAFNRAAIAQHEPASNSATRSEVDASASASPAKAERALPFHGMISAVDEQAKTFTIAGKQKSRVFSVTEKTALTKSGSAATMKDIVVNEEVRGSYWKRADGFFEAKTVKIGLPSDAEKGAGKSKSRKRDADAPTASPSPQP